MTVVPFRFAELAALRAAIRHTAAGLCFDVRYRSGVPQLVVSAAYDAPDEFAQLVVRAFVHLDETLSGDRDSSVAQPTATLLIATVFRERVLDLMSKPHPSKQSRYATVSVAGAKQAYAEALAGVVREMLDRRGPAALRQIVSAMTDAQAAGE